MNRFNFIKGIGIGVAAGFAIGMAAAPRKRGQKSIAGKAIKAFGEVIDNISHAVSS